MIARPEPGLRRTPPPRPAAFLDPTGKMPPNAGVTLPFGRTRFRRTAFRFNTLQYAWAARDAKSEPLDGGKNYKLHLPPNIPVKDFWLAREAIPDKVLARTARHRRHGDQDLAHPAKLQAVLAAAKAEAAD